MSPTLPDPTLSERSGIAVLTDTGTTDDFSADSWDVHGVALSENSVTLGGSGQRRYWPADTLREASALLEGRHIVKNFHEREGQATADEVIGRVRNAGYQSGVGIVFEGDISDEDIARKVANGYLDVSAVVGVANEHYDESRDAYVVDSISAFRDIAVVADGASRGNKVDIGSNPAVAALSRRVLAPSWDTLRRSEARTPSYDGTRPDDSWPDGGPSLSDYVQEYYDEDPPSDWSDLSQDAQDWIAAKTLLGDSDAQSADGGISYPVVHPDGDLSESGLQSARSMAGHADGAAESIRSITATLLEDEFGHEFDDDSDTETNTRHMTRYTDPLEEGDTTRLDTWANFLASLGGTDTDAFDVGHLHTLIAAEIEGASVSDVSEALPGEQLADGLGAAEAHERISALISGDGGGSGGGQDEGSEGEDGEETETNADTLSDALRHEFDLAGTTPDRCQTIKSGAREIDPETNPIARDVLNIPENREPITIDESPIAQEVLDLEEPGEDEDGEDIRDGAEEIDITENALARTALGLDD